MVAAVPERTAQQRQDALDRANEIRSYRAELKRELRRGARSAAAVLRDPETEVETMKVVDLLLAAPKVGRVKANKLLARSRISPTKTVGGLSARQRGELAAYLSGR